MGRRARLGHLIRRDLHRADLGRPGGSLRAQADGAAIDAGHLDLHHADGRRRQPWHMLAFRAGMGALAGFNSAATVLVSTQVPEQRLGYSLGWLGTGQLVGSLIGPLIGGAVADVTGSYRLPFFFAGVISLLAFLGTWWFVPERFTPPDRRTRKRLRCCPGCAIVTRTDGLLALIMVMLMAQFATQAVQPVVTLFVQEMLGQRPDLATLGGLAFSVTGIAGVLAVPFLGRKSDVIGYRTVLLISLFGAALFTAPQACRSAIGRSWSSGSVWACSSAASCRRPIR